MRWTEGNNVAGDTDTHWDASNARIFIQETTAGGSFTSKEEPTTCHLKHAIGSIQALGPNETATRGSGSWVAVGVNHFVSRSSR